MDQESIVVRVDVPPERLRLDRAYSGETTEEDAMDDRTDSIDPFDSGEIAGFVESLGGEIVALGDPGRLPELDPTAFGAGGPGRGRGA